MKKLVGLISLLLTVQGCQSGLTKPDSGPRNYLMSISGSSIDHWLHKRHNLCLLPAIDQRARYQALVENNESSDKENKIERLLITTCNPDMTPGLLRQTLGDLMYDNSWSESEIYLLELIRDFDRSAQLLEQENRRLAKELESTIQGIRDIEADIDNLDQNGGAP